MKNTVTFINRETNTLQAVEPNTFKFFNTIKNNGLTFADYSIRWGKNELTIRSIDLTAFQRLIASPMTVKNEGGLFLTLRF